MGRVNRTVGMVGAALALLGLGIAGSARATDEIIDPDGQYVVATSYYSIIYAGPRNLLDNSGLSSPLNTGDPVPATWPSHSTDLADMYWSGSERTPSITFVLPGCYDIDAIHYWNFNQASAPHTDGVERSFKLVYISVSTDSIAGPYTALGSYTFEKAPGSPDYTGVTLPLGQTVRAHYVRFQVLSDWGGDFPGMSEIRFLGTDAGIPKPAIDQGLSPQSVSIGHTVTFSVAASGPGPLTYQWRKDGVNIASAGRYRGANTPTLTITDANATLNGNYDVVVTGECGITTSVPAALTVTGTLSPPDAARALGIAAGMEAPAPDDFNRLDLAGNPLPDGSIDVRDAAAVIRIVFGR